MKACCTSTSLHVLTSHGFADDEAAWALATRERVLKMAPASGRRWPTTWELPTSALRGSDTRRRSLVAHISKSSSSTGIKASRRAEKRSAISSFS